MMKKPPVPRVAFVLLGANENSPAGRRVAPIYPALQ